MPVSDTILNEIATLPVNQLSTIALGVVMGRMIYRLLTDRKPLSNVESATNQENDLKRYNRMCTLYTSILGFPSIPEEWVLEGDCPVHCAAFASNAENFRSNIENLRFSSLPMKTIIIKIIASIERRFLSVNKRSMRLFDWQKYRPDGFEAMFFSELVHWLTVEVSTASTISQSTADMLAKRILYCKAVYEEVFFFRGDEKEHNLVTLLAKVIHNLEVLHQDIVKSIEAASFNKLIDSIDHDFLEMTTLAFDVLYLALPNVNQEDIQIDEFLNPEPGIDHKVEALGSLLLGQWLKLTLQTAGVVSNNFQGTNERLNMDVIQQHLNFDLNNSKAIRMDKCLGLHPFIIKNRELSLEILAKCREVHKEILNLYYIRRSLVKAARLGIDWGEAWLYTHQEGKTIVKGLVYAVENARVRFTEAINGYWKIFYSKSFLNHKRAEKLDNRNADVQYLQKANKRISRINICSRNSQSTITAISNHIEKAQKDLNATTQLKHQLVQDLFEYLRRISSDTVPQEMTQVIQSLRTIADESTQSNALFPQTMVIPREASINQVVVSVPKNKLIIYQHAKERLQNNAANTPMDIERFTLRPGTTYHTKIQAVLVENFLGPYHSLANSNFLMSAYYTLTWFNMDRFKECYSRINSIMKELYKNENLIVEPTVSCLNEDGISTVETPITQLDSNQLTDTERDTYEKYRNNLLYWNIQLVLIDQLFKVCLFNLSREVHKNHYNFLIESSDLEIYKTTEKGDNVEVTIDKQLLDYAGGAFAEQLEQLNAALKREKIEHEKTKAQLEEVRSNLARTSVELQSAQAEITSRKQELTNKCTELEMKSIELASKIRELEQLGIEVARKSDKVKVQNQFLEKLLAELEVLKANQSPPRTGQLTFFQSSQNQSQPACSQPLASGVNHNGSHA